MNCLMNYTSFIKPITIIVLIVLWKVLKMNEIDNLIQFLREQEHIDYQFVRLVETWASTYKTHLMLEGGLNESMEETT